MKQNLMSKWPASKRSILLMGLLLIVAFRIYLVADRDIIATYSPYDEYWHVDAALRRIVGGDYHHMAFAHLPVYAIWLMILSDFGIPARLAIDIFWLIGSGYLAFAIFKLSQRVWAGILAFFLLAYHPYSLVLFDRALAETFLTVITALVLAAALEIWNLRQCVGSAFRRNAAFVVLSVGFAIAYHTRKEGFLLLLPVFGMAMLSLVKVKEWWDRENRNKLGIPLILAPIMATLVMGVLLAGVNYSRWGVFARYELASPQYVRAINALLAIDTGKPTPRHVTITKATRDIAYRASPTFAQLRPFFDGQIGQSLERLTTEVYDPGVFGEIGDWVFYWAIRDAAASVGWHSSAINAESQYKKIADELEDSFLKGAVTKRSALIPFVDPDWGKWIKHLPMSVLSELGLVISPSVPPRLSAPKENATSKQFADFSLLLGRHRVPREAEMSGWVVAPAGSMVGLGGGQGAWLWSLLDAPARTDIEGAIPFFTVAPVSEQPSYLYVRLVSGQVGKLDLHGVSGGQAGEISGLDGIRVGIDQMYIPADWGGQIPRLERISGYLDPSKQNGLPALFAKGWSLIGWSLLVLTLIAIFIAVYKQMATDMMVIVGLISLYTLGRAGLFGILDASSWSGISSRYMFPAVPFFISGVVLGTAMLIQLIRGKY